MKRLQPVFHFLQIVTHLEMAEKLNEFASRLSKGTPKGMGVGITLLAGVSAAVIGLYKSMFTGKSRRITNDGRRFAFQSRVVIERLSSIALVESIRTQSMPKDFTSGATPVSLSLSTNSHSIRIESHGFNIPSTTIFVLDHASSSHPRAAKVGHRLSPLPLLHFARCRSTNGDDRFVPLSRLLPSQRHLFL